MAKKISTLASQKLDNTAKGRPIDKLRSRQEQEKARKKRYRKLWIRSSLVVISGSLVLLIIFLTGANGSPSPSSPSSSSKFAYAVGTPRPGGQAPDFTLPSTKGGTFNLQQAEASGKMTLLYFQEGVDCEPCWTQLKSIQTDLGKFHSLGIGEIVSITTDPLGQLQQKAADESVSLQILSDSNLTVSKTYHANEYGMMGTSMDGHSFILVGPSGKIEWRADYGGAPNYTMYVPDATLLSQMQSGMSHQSS